MVKLLLLVIPLLPAVRSIEAITVEWPLGCSYDLFVGNDQFSFHRKVYVSLKEKSIRLDFHERAYKLFFIEEDGYVKRYLYYHTTNDEAANVTHCVSHQSWNIRWPPHDLPDITGMSLTENLTVNGAPSQKFEKRAHGPTSFTQEVWLQLGDSTKGPIPIRYECKIINSERRTKRRSNHNIIAEFYNYQPLEPEQSVWIRPPNVPCVPQETAEWQEYEMELSTMLSHLDHQRPLRKAKGVKMSNEYPSLASPFPYTEEEISTLASQLPDTFDWRFLGAVKSVKNQFCCGSGWAFGVVGAMEGAYYIKTGFLGEMSEQAMIDCGWWTDPNTNGEMRGCWGGDPRAAFDWIKNHGGLPWTADYGDYKNGNGKCTLNHVKTVGAIKGYVHVKADVDAVKVALYHHGPLTVSIFVPLEFEFYTSGVFKYPGKAGPVNHGVLLIGYGSLNGEDYWLIKNSWGEQWGISGYGLISADNNTMHLLNHVYYPEMV